MNKLKLEPTAALVMVWALPLYEKGAVCDFVRQLDLSSGAELFCRCQAACNWYGEVIRNRKHFIHNQIVEHLKADGLIQIVLLAAGKSPLGLELLLQCSSKISAIFEVDITGMAEKETAYQRTAPEVANRLKCITADIASQSLRKSSGKRDVATILLRSLSWRASATTYPRKP
jgi:hypothetical protein